MRDEIRFCRVCNGRMARGWKGTGRKGGCDCRAPKKPLFYGNPVRSSVWLSTIPRGVNVRKRPNKQLAKTFGKEADHG